MSFDLKQKFCGCAMIAVLLSIPGIARAQVPDLHFHSPDLYRVGITRQKGEARLRTGVGRRGKGQRNRVRGGDQPSARLEHRSGGPLRFPEPGRRFVGVELRKRGGGFQVRQPHFCGARPPAGLRSRVSGFRRVIRGRVSGQENIWEIEPFLNFGVMSGDWEIVGWTRFGIPTNQDPGEEVETEFHYDFSTLYHFFVPVPRTRRVERCDGPQRPRGRLGHLQRISWDQGGALQQQHRPVHRLGRQLSARGRGAECTVESGGLLSLLSSITLERHCWKAGLLLGGTAPRRRVGGPGRSERIGWVPARIQRSAGTIGPRSNSSKNVLDAH